MVRVLIVSYYELKDALKSAAESLIKLGHAVQFYPLFQYAYDQHDRKDDYPRHFRETLVDQQPDVVLCWFIGVPADVLREARQAVPDARWVLYNWDDPWMWREPSMDLAAKAGIFDVTAVTCRDTLERYRKTGVAQAVYAPPGHDPEVFKPLFDLEADPDPAHFDCDVSFCCTNLYNDDKYDDQFYPRKQLVDALYVAKDIRFHLYGPEHLRGLYPDAYQGMVSHPDSNRVFNRSRIVLCTHVCKNGDGYMNERTVLAIAAGSLLLVDPVAGLDKLLRPDVDCIYIQRNDPVGQIRQILANYKKYWPLRRSIRRHADKFTWDRWAVNLQLCFPAATRRRRLVSPLPDNRLLPESWLKLATVFGDMRRHDPDGLRRLRQITQQYPDVDINSCLDYYLTLVD